MLFLPVVLLSAYAAAHPIAEKRQATSAWTDPSYSEPANIQVNQLGACSYQLTFERDAVDSVYTFSFDAVYGGTAVPIAPIEGNAAISRPGPIGTNPSPSGRYRLEDISRVLSIHEFDNACDASGAAPTAFVLSTALPEWVDYPYTNVYRSAPVAVTAPAVPAVPASVGVTQNAAGGITATWAPVDGATGYFVVARYRQQNSEVGFVNAIETFITAPDTTSLQLDVPAESVVVAARGGPGVVSATGSTPEVAMA